MTSILPNGKQYYPKPDGTPAVGWKVYTFDTNTSNPRATYSDINASSPNANPVILDARGEAKIFWNGNYRVTLKDNLDNSIWTVDDVEGDTSHVQSTNIVYGITAAEAALPVTPKFFIYAPGPRIDVRRYLTAWDDGSLQTTGLQDAINYTYARKGRLILPDGLNVASGALALTMSGNRSTQGLAIEGAGWVGSKITQAGSPAALFAFSGATPTGNPSEAPLVLENFSIVGTGNTAHGVTLNGLSYWRMSNMQMRNCDRGINLSSALVGLIDQGTMSNENNYGIYTRKNGAGSGCNLIKVKDCIFNLNSLVGLDIGSGVKTSFQGCDVEANGTAADTTTGGMFVRATVDDDIGFAIVEMDDMWFESNKGQPFRVENTGGLFLSISNSLFLSGEAFREILISGANRVSIENCFSPGGGGDLWDITATYLSIKNSQVTTLTDTGVTYPTYENFSTSTANYIKGLTDSYTGTLTGCTTSPTATIFIAMQGNEVILNIGSTIAATSNTTSCTITGLPARYRPTASRKVLVCSLNNGVEATMIGSVETDGSIHLRQDTTFTAAGTKGAGTGPLTGYRI